MAAARLRKPAADHVADAKNYDVQPRLIGQEIVAAPVGRLNQVRGKQNPGGRDDEDHEFGRLVESLRLVAAPGDDPSARRVHSGAISVRRVAVTYLSGIVDGGHLVLLLMQSKYVDRMNWDALHQRGSGNYLKDARIEPCVRDRSRHRADARGI